MNLSDLQLNRYLYRGNDFVPPDTSVLVNNVNTSAYGAGGSNDVTNMNVSGNIPSGTVITACTLQSSPSSDRVEINPNDTFKAYNNGVAIVTIDKNGISGSGGTVTFTTLNATTANIDTLDVAVKFIYFGQDQPVLYTGEIDLATGNITFGPTGWTATRTALGTYVITHNLGLSAPFLRIFATQKTAFTGSPFVVTGANTFTVVWQSSSGVGVDVNFNFVALRYLP